MTDPTKAPSAWARDETERVVRRLYTFVDADRAPVATALDEAMTEGARRMQRAALDDLEYMSCTCGFRIRALSPAEVAADTGGES